ncbi:DUF2069 domain-containing protein [Luteimonas yindakuii]|uniref:DUF2069 domain-containing protein n=1 Tax=Luteimonas yindakuii TaxID=2565782 RepID=A0A4Z1R7Q7_9GAMM|nr:DUF2069 domain-containing protein [Luteimonas yindakuii]TKS54635.1 DUF2069 domain-containing protein [Luteimonas yindakuii]
MRRGAATWVLAMALAALAAVYGAWLAQGEHLVAALFVLVLPPLLLAVFVLAGSARARFWSGVFGLFWFSHAVMEAWSTPAARGPALALLALSLLVIGSASWPGLRARFARGRG